MVVLTGTALEAILTLVTRSFFLQMIFMVSSFMFVMIYFKNTVVVIRGVDNLDKWVLTSYRAGLVMLVFMWANT
jgi:hypothetical protein